MTLPVSFNEPTSLLQRVAEDMEYTELLDTAAERADSTERMVYVATFAASEYASTIGRVAKPFNPLLGETYEYVRPDKGAGYRFFIEQVSIKNFLKIYMVCAMHLMSFQVSHHPPVGAAWAESPKWDYYVSSQLCLGKGPATNTGVGRVSREIQVLWQVIRNQPVGNMVLEIAPDFDRRENGTLHMEESHIFCGWNHHG